MDLEADLETSQDSHCKPTDQEYAVESHVGVIQASLFCSSPPLEHAGINWNHHMPWGVLQMPSLRYVVLTKKAKVTYVSKKQLPYFWGIVNAVRGTGTIGV